MATYVHKFQFIDSMSEMGRIGDSLIWVQWLSLAVPFHLIFFMFIWNYFTITQWILSCTNSAHYLSSRTQAFPFGGIVGFISSIPTFNLSTPDGYCMLFSAEPYFSVAFLSSLPFYSFIDISLFSLYTSHALYISVIILLYSHLPSK